MQCALRHNTTRAIPSGAAFRGMSLPRLLHAGTFNDSTWDGQRAVRHSRHPIQRDDFKIA